VTPEIVEDVAKEFRLDAPTLIGEVTPVSPGEMDFQRAMRILLDRYSDRS
jgi:hypothetical protein